MTTHPYVWDHTVTFVNDLHSAQKAFADQGITASYGGKHVGHGTENALAYFGTNYVELLSVYSRDEAENEREDTGLIYRDAARSLPAHEGFYRHGLRVNNIEARAEELHRQGIETGPIVPGNRTTADGREIRWKLLWLLRDTKAEENQPRYPFILDWLEDEPTHEKTLESSGLLRQHPDGDIRTREAIWEVPDPKRTARRLSEVFEFPLTVNSDGSADLVTGRDLIWHIQEGSHNGIVDLKFDSPSHPFYVRIGSARFSTL